MNQLDLWTGTNRSLPTGWAIESTLVNVEYANYAMLVSSVMPIIEAHNDTMKEAKAFKDEIMERGQRTFEDKLMGELRSKMSFHREDESPDDLWADLEAMLRESRADWTVFWRQLTLVAKEFPGERRY